MTALEITQWLDDMPLKLIHRNGQKRIYIRLDAGEIVSVTRFESVGALEDFRDRRRALLDSAGDCPSLCIPNYLREWVSPWECLLAETMPVGTEGVFELEALFEALTDLHDRGWTHMDVKPENLLWFDGRWKLIDFDGAMRMGERYKRRQITFEYAPPEASRYDLADGGDDLYAAALMLYERKNGGRLPLERHDRRFAVRMRGYMPCLPPPRGCTRGEARFFKKALARRRTRRYATIRTLWRDWQIATNEERE